MFHSGIFEDGMIGALRPIMDNIVDLSDMSSKSGFYFFFFVIWNDIHMCQPLISTKHYHI